MNHCGRGWVVSWMALQLVACGNGAVGVADEAPGQRRSAQPGRTPSDVPDETKATWAARLAAPEMERQRAGLGFAASSDASPGEPELGPVVTPQAGWEAAQCAGSGTRRVTLSGNLDAWTTDLWPRTFDPEDPANTANFSVTFPAFDDDGRQQAATVYFARRDGIWDYHVLMDGTAFEIGAGQLSYDDQGTLTSEVTRELRLLTPTGPGHAVELDLSGMTSTFDPCDITSLSVDGSQARWGASCSAGEAMPEEEPVIGPQCAVAATTRLALRANLADSSVIASEPWNALAPDAQLTTLLIANDAHGAVIDFALHLRKSSAQTWDYHVLLSGEAPGPEVASGALHFNDNGSLGAVTTTRSLQFPSRAGEPGDAIKLDFGSSTAEGGSGVDGVTALPGASFEVWQQPDGAVLDCLPRATKEPLPTFQYPRCAGERTTAVWLGFNLDPATPLGDASYQATTIVYDAALDPHEVALQFRHVEELKWECLVTTAGMDVGVVDLYFTKDGAPDRVENTPTLRLPLADGSAGPPIQLAFDEPWVVTSFTSASSGWLAPNGAAPATEGCVE